MKVITLKDILKYDTMERMTIEDSFELLKKINKEDEDALIDSIVIRHRRFTNSLNEVDKNERDIRKIAQSASIGWTRNWTFWFNREGLYFNVDGIPMLKSTGKLHDYLKYGDALQKYSNSEFYEVDKEYELFRLSYSGLIEREIKQWESTSYDGLGLNDNDDEDEISQFSKSYKKFLNKHLKKELTETLGIIDKYGVNTIGAKREAYFDTATFDLRYANAHKLVEILRIEETEEILGKKGILQLFVRSGFYEWYDKDCYKWHFTPENRVAQMELVKADSEAFEHVQREVQSDGVLNFAIKNYPLSMNTISHNSHKQEYAEAMALYITNGNEKEVGVYENEYGYFEPLCTNYHHDVPELMLMASEEEYRHDAALHISNSFSTQSFEYQPKENEKFLLSIQSESTRFKVDDECKYALCLGDVGSLSFAMDEKLFEEELKIEVTSFNSDCH